MANYTIWYRKKVTAKSLSECIKKKKKIKSEFHSIESNKDDEREHISAIGFQTDTEDDDWED